MSSGKWRTFVSVSINLLDGSTREKDVMDERDFARFEFMVNLFRRDNLYNNSILACCAI